MRRRRPLIANALHVKAARIELYLKNLFQIVLVRWEALAIVFRPRQHWIQLRLQFLLLTLVHGCLLCCFEIFHPVVNLFDGGRRGHRHSHSMEA